MKLRTLLAAALVILCSGCVYYGDPYYRPYGYGPAYSYPYGPAVYVNPAWGLFYPNLYFNFRHHGYYPYHRGYRR